MVWVDYDDKQIRMVGGELLVKPCTLHSGTRLSKAKWCQLCDHDCSFQGKAYRELLDSYRKIMQ